MSWDIFVQDLPSDSRSVADIPDDFLPQPLMPRSDLIARIREVVPEADFSDPAWGVVEGPDYSIEINVGDDDPVSSFAFHVRGGDLAAGVVAAILDHLGLRGLDTAQDESGTGFFDPATAVNSLRRWRSFRDRTLAAPDADPPRRGLTGRLLGRG